MTTPTIYLIEAEGVVSAEDLHITQKHISKLSPTTLQEVAQTTTEAQVNKSVPIVGTSGGVEDSNRYTATARETPMWNNGATLQARMHTKMALPKHVQNFLHLMYSG